MSGLNGLGCEIAKNVLLGGVKSMTIHDTKPTTLWDLCSQYYLTEKDVGRCPCSSQHKIRSPGTVQTPGTVAKGQDYDRWPCHAML